MTLPRFSVDDDSGNPAVSVWSPTHAHMTAFRKTTMTVQNVPKVRDVSKVYAATVQAVAISVVNVQPFLAPQNKLVEQNRTTPDERLNVRNVSTSSDVPFVLVNEREVFQINKGPAGLVAVLGV
jgi:hypothetical protein